MHSHRFRTSIPFSTSTHPARQEIGICPKVMFRKMRCVSNAERGQDKLPGSRRLHRVLGCLPPQPTITTPSHRFDLSGSGQQVIGRPSSSDHHHHHHSHHFERRHHHGLGAASPVLSLPAAARAPPSPSSAPCGRRRRPERSSGAGRRRWGRPDPAPTEQRRLRARVRSSRTRDRLLPTKVGRQTVGLWCRSPQASCSRRPCCRNRPAARPAGRGR